MISPKMTRRSMLGALGIGTLAATTVACSSGGGAGGSGSAGGGEGVPPGRAGCRRGEGLWGLMGTADLSVDGAEAIDGEGAGVRSRGDRARRPARTRTGRGPSSSTAPRLSRHREDPLGDVPPILGGRPRGCPRAGGGRRPREAFGSQRPVPSLTELVSRS